MSPTPIAEHALPSDRHSSSVVTAAASAHWPSFPRFEHPSVLGRLPSDRGGSWQIAPRA